MCKQPRAINNSRRPSENMCVSHTWICNLKSRRCNRLSRRLQVISILKLASKSEQRVLLADYKKNIDQDHLLVFVTHSSLWCNSLRLTSEGLNRLLPRQDGRRGGTQPRVETCHHNRVWDSHTGRQGCLTTVQMTACDPVISSICPIDDAFIILCARGRVCTEVENESLALASPAEPRAHLGQKAAHDAAQGHQGWTVLGGLLWKCNCLRLQSIRLKM